MDQTIRTDRTGGRAPRAGAARATRAALCFEVPVRSHKIAVGSRRHPPMTRRSVGRYEVVAEIGDGAMGRVYRAQDPVVRRPVAIKTVKSEYLTKVTKDEYLRRLAPTASLPSAPPSAPAPPPSPLARRAERDRGRQVGGPDPRPCRPRGGADVALRAGAQGRREGEGPLGPPPHLRERPLRRSPARGRSLAPPGRWDAPLEAS